MNKEKKISDFPAFVGQKLLLKAQARGLEITKWKQRDAVPVILIGLASLLAENKILKDEE